MCFSEAEELIEANVSSSILKFNKGLLTAGECMKKTIFIGKERQQILFDLECKQSRQIVRQYLHNYHNGNSDTELVIHKRETSIRNFSDRRKININD